ncbi:MAG TPA: alpha/beta hydrolase [Polyangiales bacterium]|nr:alpha/beta hydrolase [Polyangiales bacterium]
MSSITVEQRFHIRESGRGKQPIMFAHGYGCDQSMWRFVAPAFEANYRVILFDLAGSGRSDPAAYDRHRHGALLGYAEDMLSIIGELQLEDVVFVGHSVSAMIGALATTLRPDRFDSLVMIGPSPCYINDEKYIGGFTRSDIDGLVDAVDSNYLGWASTMAPIIMGTPDRPELVEELRNSFCRSHPEIARAFAKVTFLSDNRNDLPRVHTRSLVIQVSDDVIAPVSVGQYVHEHLPDSELAVLKTRGHCPHLSEPELTIAVMRSFLQLQRERRDGQ